VYILVQLGIAVIVRKGLEAFFASFSYLSLSFLGISVVWALVSIGTLLQKTRTVSNEYIRLVLTGLMLLYAIWQVSIFFLLFIS
jgi:ABC-type dipeptide/oligopeptide/nickel transport system permease subunit